MSDSPTSNPPAVRPGGRIEFLDGIRGLAALFVVVHHVFQFAGIPAPVVREGWAAVDVFFVLSGFVLMRPATRDGGYVRGGLRDYLSRRAWRILPPYYAAIALSSACLLLLPLDSGYRGPLVPLTAPDLLTHLALVHNLRGHYIYGINPTFWSIAFEWQLYFALPLLFLPAWRRLGVGPLLAACWAAATLPEVLPMQRLLVESAGVFLLGVAAASWVAGAEHRIGIVAGLVVAAIPAAWAGDQLQAHALVALAASGLIVALEAGRLGSLRRPLESRALLTLGAFSYSLYLIHMPILALLVPTARAAAGGGAGLALVLLAVGLPATLAASYGFYRLFERPTLGRPARRLLPAAAPP